MVLLPASYPANMQLSGVNCTSGLANFNMNFRLRFSLYADIAGLTKLYVLLLYYINLKMAQIHTA